MQPRKQVNNSDQLSQLNQDLQTLNGDLEQIYLKYSEKNIWNTQNFLNSMHQLITSTNALFHPQKKEHRTPELQSLNIGVYTLHARYYYYILERSKHQNFRFDRKKYEKMINACSNALNFFSIMLEQGFNGKIDLSLLADLHFAYDTLVKNNKSENYLPLIQEAYGMCDTFAYINSLRQNQAVELKQSSGISENDAGSDGQNSLQSSGDMAASPDSNERDVEEMMLDVFDKDLPYTAEIDHFCILEQNIAYMDDNLDKKFHKMHESFAAEKFFPLSVNEYQTITTKIEIILSEVFQFCLIGTDYLQYTHDHQDALPADVMHSTQSNIIVILDTLEDKLKRLAEILNQEKLLKLPANTIEYEHSYSVKIGEDIIAIEKSDILETHHRFFIDSKVKQKLKSGQQTLLRLSIFEPKKNADNKCSYNETFSPQYSPTGK